VPASQTETVECPFNVVVPTPPMVMDGCGKMTNMTGPVMTSGTNTVFTSTIVYAGAQKHNAS
jgi:hypothetical protein